MMRVTMDQAFKNALAAALIKMGGTIHDERVSEGSTSWTALVTFPPEPSLHHKVTQLLWAKFPGASVRVEES